MDRRSSGTRADVRRSARRESDGLWDWNLTSNRIHYSPGWIALAGCLDQEIGTAPEDWFGRVHPEDGPRLLRDIERTRRDPGSDFEFEYRLRHQDGTYRWMRSRGLVVRNDQGEAIRLTGTQVDVTVETVTDAVTGLPNELLLLERLAQSIARAKKESTFNYALVLIELCSPSGAAVRPLPDALLRAAARRLETCLRLPEAMPELRANDLVARVIGDRLAVLLEGLDDLSHARDVGDRILASMLEPVTIRSQELRLAPAIGIVLSASGYTQPDEALRDAETALHRARVLGGSHCALFDADVLETQQATVRIEADLKPALHRGEFELVYQPVVSLAAGAGVGFEALVRWRHPALGLVPPLDFIPIAERTGDIVPLGAWILQQACRQLKEWQTSVPSAENLWVSVNVSGVQLHEGNLVEQVEDALRRSGLEARHLVLELTEGVAMHHPAAATTVLMRLRAMGIRISIDDFGTGYSSLAYLRQFPVDSLKIDQSFVRRIAHDKDTAAIVSGILTMAAELGLHVVAEGVETDDQKEVLQSLRCQSAQGFLFAKPLDVARVEEFLRAPAGDDVPPRRLQAASGLSRVLSERLVAVAALAALASTGVGIVVYRGLRAETPPAALTIPAPAAADPTDTASARVPDPIVTPAARPPSAVTPPTNAPAAASGEATSERRSNARAERTFKVVHLHRFGNCEGRLVLSQAGLTFHPDDEKSNDAVAVNYGDFQFSADGKTLTIRAPRRTYRFNMPDGIAKAEAELQIAAIGDAIARAGVR